jgi:hypothetical protein
MLRSVIMLLMRCGILCLWFLFRRLTLDVGL